MNPSVEVADFERRYAEFQASNMGEPELMGWLIEHLDEPRGALEALGILQRALSDLEEELVEKGRGFEMMSWREIGSALGRTRQSVWERYRDPEEQDPNE